MNEMKCNDFECVQKPTQSRIRLNTLYKQIQPLSRIKTLNGVRRISPVGGKETVYGGKDLPKSQVLSSEVWSYVAKLVKLTRTFHPALP